MMQRPLRYKECSVSSYHDTAGLCGVSNDHDNWNISLCKDSNYHDNISLYIQRFKLQYILLGYAPLHIMILFDYALLQITNY